MAGANEAQLGVRPGPREEPGDVGRSAEVEQAVDEDSADAGQPSGVAKQFTVVEPGGVREVVRTEAGESHPKVRVEVAGVRCPAVLERDDRILPVAPILRCLDPHGRIGVGVQKPVVSRNKVVRITAALAKAHPLLRKEPAGLVIEPVHV